METKRQNDSATTTTELENQSLWEAYWRQPDDGAGTEALLEQYLPLARRVLHRIAIRLPSHVRTEDLLNSALLGLYGAISRFNPDTGMNFVAYACRRIRGAILDELRACDPLSRRQRELLGNVEEIVRQWSADHGEFPDSEQIAHEMEMDHGDLTQLLEHAQPWLSLDMPCGGDKGGMLLSEVLADDATLPDQEADREEMRRFLRRAFRDLSDREQKILYLYYYEELRLREIALLFEVTEARVCQIHSLAVAKLRQAVVAMM